MAWKFVCALFASFLSFFFLKKPFLFVTSESLYIYFVEEKMELFLWLASASFAFIFPFVLEVAVEVEMEDSDKGGNDVASSPKKEVEERAG